MRNEDRVVRETIRALIDAERHAGGKVRTWKPDEIGMHLDYAVRAAGEDEQHLALRSSHRAHLLKRVSAELMPGRLAYAKAHNERVSAEREADALQLRADLSKRPEDAARAAAARDALEMIKPGSAPVEQAAPPDSENLFA